ncbi:MAG: cysteine desulfurase-like protein [Gemmatimonadota bacterium]
MSVFAGASTGTLKSLDEIRAAFPALSRREGKNSVAYFDGPGGTQVPLMVADAMRDYLLHHNANTHWCYPTSEETDAAISSARCAAADFLNASPDEIAFGANMTTLTFHLARGLGRAWGPGDEVVVTELDHHANVAPWRALERDRGLTVRVVPLAQDGVSLDWAALERVISPRTRLLAIGGASNALGTINDLPRAIRLARAHGVLTFVDAVHYAPHVLVDVRTLDCDFLACSPYKFYGPHLGILYGRRGLIESLDIPKLAPAPESSPERLETGTGNHEGIVGAATAIDYLASLAPGQTRRSSLEAAFAGLHARAAGLLEQLWMGLGEVPGVHRHGVSPESPRTPTVAFTVKGADSEKVARALASDGIFVSNGDFYATTVVERLGFAREGVVRAGCACYTSTSEVERLVEAVRRFTS